MNASQNINLAAGRRMRKTHGSLVVAALLSMLLAACMTPVQPTPINPGTSTQPPQTTIAPVDDDDDDDAEASDDADDDDDLAEPSDGSDD